MSLERIGGFEKNSDNFSFILFETQQEEKISYI